MQQNILVCATAPEAALLIQKLALKKKRGTPVFQDETGEIQLVQTGVGPERALKTFSQFVESLPPSQDVTVLHFGLSGGLTSELKTGDLIVPTAFVDLTDRSDRSDHITLTLPHKTGALLTSSTVLDTPEKKSAAGKKFNAIAVDMESYPLARLCRERGIPYFSVRAIFDPLSWNLSDLGDDTLTPEGNLDALAFTRQLVKKPKLLFSIPRYAQASRLATKRLTEFVLHALDRM